MPRPLALFVIFWGLFAVSWLLAALWRSPAIQQRSGPKVWLYRGLLVLGLVLLNHRTSAAFHAARLWHVGWTGAYVLAFLTLPGFAFAWWARLHLGNLWSGAVTVKADHRVVDTGPYRFVRHPIYTGILFACLVSTIAVATWVAIAGFIAIVAGFWVKARLEEDLLAQELGAGNYAAYTARVPMLMPFWPVRG